MFWPDLLAASASPSPAPSTDVTPTGFGLFLAFLTALGFGSLVGSLATSIVGYINAERDRKARREEIRFNALREGFASVVNAVLDIERWLYLVDVNDEESQERARSVLSGATAEFVAARAGLLLDVEGERIIRQTVELTRNAELYRAGRANLRQLVAAAQATPPRPGGGDLVTQRSEELRGQREEISRKIQQVIDEARAAVNRIAGTPL